MTNIVPWLCSEKLKFWQLFIQLPYKGKCLYLISGGGQYSVAVEATSPRWKWQFTPKSCPYTNFFFDPITPTLHSNWMLWLGVRSSFKLGFWSVHHCQTNSVVEQSSDGQVALNRHREGHFVLFDRSKSTVCLCICHRILKVIFSLLKGGLPPPLNPLFSF